MDPKEKMNISINTISKWGLHRQVKSEQIIDLNLKNVQPPTNTQLNEIKKEWCQINNIKDDEKLKDWQIKNGYTADQWNEFISRKWKWTKWCLKEFKDKIPNYYLERKSMLDKVTYSLIRVSDQDFANELFLRIKEKESTFEEIAKEYSKGPERNNYGLVGPFPVGKAHPELASLLKISKAGQIWPPKKLESWWVIVQLNSLENTPLDETLYTQLALELGFSFLEKKIFDYFSKNLT